MGRWAFPEPDPNWSPEEDAEAEMEGGPPEGGYGPGGAIINEGSLVLSGKK